jgi:hypothetical protein
MPVKAIIAREAGLSLSCRRPVSGDSSYHAVFPFRPGGLPPPPPPLHPPRGPRPPRPTAPGSPPEPRPAGGRRPDRGSRGHPPSCVACWRGRPPTGPAPPGTGRRPRARPAGARSGSRFYPDGRATQRTGAQSRGSRYPIEPSGPGSGAHTGRAQMCATSGARFGAHLRQGPVGLGGPCGLALAGPRTGAARGAQGRPGGRSPATSHRAAGASPAGPADLLIRSWPGLRCRFRGRSRASSRSPPFPTGSLTSSPAGRVLLIPARGRRASASGSHPLGNDCTGTVGQEKETPGHAAMLAEKNG